MRLGILFSGGKDSLLAMDRTLLHEEVACLITIHSSNKESYMFHTPCIEHTVAQAKAMDIPHIVVETEGEKEVELEDLKKAINQAMEEHHIEGVVTGAIASIYQASRVQRMCAELGIRCFNPLWQECQETVLRELVGKGYQVMIAGVFAYPLGEEFLGRIIDENTIEELLKLGKDVGFNPAGEGGEIETFVLDGPVFKHPLHAKVVEKRYHNYAGTVTLEVEQ